MRRSALSASASRRTTCAPSMPRRLPRRSSEFLGRFWYHPDMIDLLFIQVVGGVFLLLYGVRLTGQGFELAFGARLRGLWSEPGGRLRAFAAGALGTGLVQSSGAVVTLLVSFAEIAPLPLAQSLAVVLGADLGSTLTVQILSFRIHQYALVVLSAGVALHLWGRRGSVR